MNLMRTCGLGNGPTKMMTIKWKNSTTQLLTTRRRWVANNASSKITGTVLRNQANSSFMVRSTRVRTTSRSDSAATTSGTAQWGTILNGSALIPTLMILSLKLSALLTRRDVVNQTLSLPIQVQKPNVKLMKNNQWRIPFLLLVKSTSLKMTKDLTHQEKM